MSTEKKKRGRPDKKTAPKTPEVETPTPAPEENPKRHVQTEIPGTERPRIKAIDEAAEDYVIVRDKRMELTQKEVAAKQRLTDLMHKHAEKIGKNGDGEMVYRYSDMAVVLKPAGETLKVKHVEEDEVSVGAAPKDNSEGEA